ncbi:hypothetical protein WJ972_28620 [Achromobacter insuavis]
MVAGPLQARSAMPHPDQSRLDNPVWFALAERQAHLRQGDGLAARYQPDVAPFAALRNTTREAFAALERLMAPDQAVLVQTLAALPPVDGLRSETLFSFFQMVDEAPAPAVDDDALHALPLHAGDVADMMALAGATRPGPFGPAPSRQAATSACAAPAGWWPWPANACSSRAMSRSAPSASIRTAVARAWPPA